MEQLEEGELYYLLSFGFQISEIILVLNLVRFLVVSLTNAHNGKGIIMCANVERKQKFYNLL